MVCHHIFYNQWTSTMFKQTCDFPLFLYSSVIHYVDNHLFYLRKEEWKELSLAEYVSIINEYGKTGTISDPADSPV